MEEKVLNPWFYDRVLAHEATVLEKAQKELVDERRALPRLEQLARQCQLGATRPGEPTTILQGIEREVADKELFVAGLRDAKVVLVGPATIDSLINEKPTTYETFALGHLPFPSLFFELRPPTAYTLPFTGTATELQAVHLVRGGFAKAGTATETQGLYLCDAYYGTPQAFERLTFWFHAQSRGEFLGKLGTTHFHLDMQGGTVAYRSSEEIWQHLKEHGAPPNFDERQPLNRRQDAEPLEQLANLAVNIVNYINAQNVRIMKRSRSVDIIRRNERNKKKHVREMKPYYLVTFRDGLITEPDEPTGRTWSAHVRWIPKGHFRRYRDENQNVYMTRWIRPCIKGPPDAPWKNNRYALLADKLEQERQLYDQHLRPKK